MKKLFNLFVALVVFAMTAQAENQLTFIGIPIDGDIDAFCNQLEQKGFTKAPEDHQRDGGYYYTGKFRGRYCHILMSYTPKTHKVCQVIVGLTQLNSYAEVRETYSDWRSWCISDYGSPTNSDSNKDTWKMGRYFLALMISPSTPNSIMLSYWNDENENLRKIESR